MRNDDPYQPQEIVLNGKLYEVMGPPFLKFYRDNPHGVRGYIATSKIIWYPNVKCDKTGVVDIGEARYAYQEKDYPDLTKEEQNEKLITAAYNVGAEWVSKAEEHNLSVKQACQGVVNSMLYMLDYGTDTTPAFKLVSRDQSDRVFVGTGDPPLKNWPANTPFEKTKPLFILHGEVYDKFRDKLTARAADLFD